MDMLDIDGIRLECRWVGSPGAAPVLVFLHEGLGSVSLWRDFPDRVAAATGLTAFVYSRQGYGGSSPVELPRPLDYLEREACDVLPRVLDAAGIASAILIGHSDGGSIALVHAAQDPRVVGVAVLAPHTFVEDMCVEAIASVRAGWPGALRGKLARHHGDNVDGAFHGWSDTWLSPAFRAMDLRPYLARIRVPLLVVQGEDDEYATLAQVTEITTRVPGSAAQVLAECGHSPQRDQPEAVLAAIAELVRRVRTPLRSPPPR